MAPALLIKIRIDVPMIVLFFNIQPITPIWTTRHEMFHMGPKARDAINANGILIWIIPDVNVEVITPKALIQQMISGKISQGGSAPPLVRATQHGKIIRTRLCEIYLGMLSAIDVLEKQFMIGKIHKLIYVFSSRIGRHEPIAIARHAMLPTQPCHALFDISGIVSFVIVEQDFDRA